MTYLSFFVILYIVVKSEEEKDIKDVMTKRLRPGSMSQQQLSVPDEMRYDEGDSFFTLLTSAIAQTGSCDEF